MGQLILTVELAHSPESSAGTNRSTSVCSNSICTAFSHAPNQIAIVMFSLGKGDVNILQNSVVLF